MSTTRDTDVRTGEAAGGTTGQENDTAATDTAAARDAGELGAAGAQLSTAPRDTVVPGSFGGVRAPGAAGWLAWTGREIVGWVRWFWRQLTSMRVALILLFLLSLGAIPGSLIPQTGQDETKVADFMGRHETLGPIYEKLGLFNVYSSAWFSAIYILLFISLIGCIVPRTWQFVGQLRGRPPGAPRRLNRLPAYTTWRTEAAPETVREEALKLLKRRRFRADAAGDAVAAEKGYLREVGNLAFHIALIVMLIAFAWGQLFKYEGNKLIVEGDGFANTLTQYDDFKSGSLFGTDDLEPFSFVLDNFRGTYEPSGPNKGTPRTYESHVTYSEGSDGKEKQRTIKVNEPLDIAGTKVYLVSHGYAPVVTVRDGKGDVVYSQAVPLLPLDSNVTSTGAIKVMDGYRDADGKKDQLGFRAFFLPAYGGANTAVVSQFPALLNPVLNLEAFHGDLGVDSGLPQSVYQLDKSNMKGFKDSKGKQLRENLKPGETMKLPNGAGSITFEKDIKEWAGFQVTEQPGSGWALAGALTAIFGLAASLFIQRRRVWVRATAGPDGVTVVEMAGLGRSESAKVPEELGDMAGILYDLAPGAPDTPDDTPETDADTDTSADTDAKSEPDPEPEAKTSTPEPPAVPAAEGAEK
ncbi:cytochrome c biogenesis protein ResB [Streptomyces phaeochromogenes]|uniref:Cytochrome c biogenesis protein ResB n=1 Tax=Streptomyces phaeochromogenes TaxID=1923 RepID=A0ABZ1HIJ3_STRPH|nr:cytochrome c biogenesis protein ResB [Streptomyces phaeochromogenes]WSD17095.1 cytochrome c biogenesis protein ResB [Streptomyces phaeochromogenes]